MTTRVDDEDTSTATVLLLLLLTSGVEEEEEGDISAEVVAADCVQEEQVELWSVQ